LAANAADVADEPLDPPRDGRGGSIDPRHPGPRHARRRLWPSTTFVLAVIIVVQVGTIVVFGSITAIRYPLWSPVDEGAHYDYVASIAEHAALPVLGKTPASEQELAIRQGVYPRHTTIVVSKFGLGGLSYEAFQPPLYYVVASPVFRLSGNYRTKAYLLRFFGLVLLVAAVALLARLSRHVLKKRWLYGLSVGLVVFMMPGVIVRSVTISNVNLAIPLVIACVSEMWIAWERKSTRRLLIAGVLVGLCVLTDLYLVELVPVLALVAIDIARDRRTRVDSLVAGATGLVAFLIVLPWLIFNEIEYHALTASAIAKREQLAVVNPDHLRYTLGQLPGLTTSSLFSPLLPQEWGGFLPAHQVLSQLATDFQVLLIPGSIVLAVALGRRLLTTGYWILFAPWVANLVLCWYIDIGQQWETGSMVARYMYPTLPLLALFLAAAALKVLRSPQLILAMTGTASIFLIGLWASLVPIIHGT